MEVADVVLRLLGAFYAFAGFVATRAALTAHFLDRAIAAISLQKANPAEIRQTAWLLISANIILMGGLFLVLLSKLALPLFLVGALGQGVYLFWLAPQYFDPAEPPDAAGRRAATNAAVLYAATTAFVAWAYAMGRLFNWHEISWWGWGAVLGIIGANAWHTLATMLRAPSRPTGFSGADREANTDDGFDPPSDPAGSTSFKLMADYHTEPLWAMDDGLYGDVAPAALKLSPALLADLQAWSDAYTASYDSDHPNVSRWSEDQQLAHAAQARPLAARLAGERPDLKFFIADGPIGLVQVQAGGE